MSALALKLIAENKQSQAAFLDLGRCGLSTLPEEIGELVWLESLSLSSQWFEWDGKEWQYRASRNDGEENTRLTDIRSLSKLGCLRALFISLTGIVDIAALAGLGKLQTLVASNTKVMNLAALSNLSHLESLDISYTEVTDLSPLANSTVMQSLAASNTEVADLAPIKGLLNLQALDVSNTNITDIAIVARFSLLHTLRLSETSVENLSPLAGLSALRCLDISQTPAHDLAPLEQMIRRNIPVHWKETTRENDEIYIKDCAISNPPDEIIAQGHAAIINYFEEQAAGPMDYLYEAKLLILGEGGGGKTSLLRRLYHPDQPLPAEQETTKGIEIERHDFTLKNGRIFRLNVWDFGGQEIYHATHQFFLTTRSIYVLVDDTRKDHKIASDPGFKDWLDLIALFGADSPVLLFQNEKGGRTKEIDFAGIRGRYANVKERYSGNLEHADAADAIRVGIEYFASLLPHIGAALPASWVKIRAEIETRAAQVAHIDQQEYFDIYTRFLPFDRIKALHLSRYLHDLGVFLHFQDDPLLARMVILQNTWATEAVYRILDDERLKRQAGRFTSDDCERVWCNPAYAGMHPELLALMQRFELCVILPDDKPRAWLAPQLLPAAKPEKLQNWAQSDDLVLRYHYDFMPKAIISRLVVRLHRFLSDTAQASMSSALFERDGSGVLADLLPSGNEIELRARGPERKALLTIAAAELDAINDGFQGLREKMVKWIPCNCTECRATSTPHFYEEKGLRKRIENRRFIIECPRSFQDVDALVLLDGVHLPQLPAWSEQKSLPQPRRVFTSSGKQDRFQFSTNQNELADGAHFHATHLFWLKDLHLKNFRCFDTLKIEFDPKLTVFVAQNGGGKSALLDAIAIAIGGFVEGFYIGATLAIENADVRLLRTNKELNAMEPQFPAGIGANAEVDGNLVDWSNAFNSINAERHWKESRQFTEIGMAMQEAVSNNQPIVLPLIAYYGTSRLHVAAKNTESSGQDELGNEFFSRTAGYQDCLDPATHYQYFEKWFTYAEKSDADLRHRQREKEGARYIEADTAFTPLLQAVRQAVDTCLSVSGWKNLSFSFTHSKLIMEHPDHGVFEVNSLSDGVRNMIAMAGDIAHRAVRLNAHLGVDVAKKTPGLVLIDEVDLHLHPSWQQVVLQKLNMAFPNIQFIVTTHSPHIVQAADPKQIIALYTDGNDIHLKEFPDGKYGFQGWEVEEVLVDVMGMADTRTMTYHNALYLFEQAIDDEDYPAALSAFEEFASLLHPDNHLRKLLKFQLAAVKGE